MKKMICIMLLFLFVIEIVPLTVHAEELYTVDIELNVDPRIKADKVPVMVQFYNDATGKDYSVSITYQTNYHGTLKVPSGTYVLVGGAVGNDFDCIYQFPFWSEYKVDGANTKWVVAVGDVEYAGEITEKEETLDKGMIDYDKTFGEEKTETTEDGKVIFEIEDNSEEKARIEEENRKAGNVIAIALTAIVVSVSAFAIWSTVKLIKKQKRN